MTVWSPIEREDPRLFDRHPGVIVISRREGEGAIAVRVDGDKAQSALDRAHRVFGRVGETMPEPPVAMLRRGRR